MFFFQFLLDSEPVGCPAVFKIAPSTNGLIKHLLIFLIERVKVTNLCQNLLAAPMK